VPEGQLGLAHQQLASGQLTHEQLTKEPRVFRVDAALTLPPVDSLVASPAATEAAPRSATLADQAADQAVLHRIASNKRPGPVTHVIHVLPEVPREQQAEAETQQARPGVLMAELQGVSPDLAMIAQAQAFSLVDEGVAREWMRLSRQLDELHATILDRMR
jgi:hypothetical protein